MTQRARTALLTLALLLLGTGLLQAQAEYNIVGVEVEGNKGASRSLILGVASVAKGTPLTPTAISETISRLYGLGLFSDVRIEAEETDGGLKVYIIVEELPKLTGLEFTNNDKIDSDDLKEKLKLGVGGYISPYLVHAKAQKIRDIYSEKGYFQAEVDHTLEYNSDSSEAILTYRITERSKVKVEKVVVSGNVAVEAGDLIKKMRNRKRGFLKTSNFAQDKYEEDLEKVIAELHHLGYIDAYLISDSMTIDSTRNRMTIFLEVYEGPRYYFGKTELSNNDILATDILKRTLKFSEGDVFDEEKYEESIMELYTTYQEIGHLHVQVFDERTTRADSIIDISYDFTEGLPSHINLVKIIGNTKTRDHVIRREISVLPGQVFNRSLLLRSVRDVMALNYFANALPTPVPTASGDVDIEFEVEEKQTGQVSAGAGYNSQDKVVGNLGMGIPNFRGTGQSLNFNTDFGSRRNSFSLSFTEPWMFGYPTLFGADIYTLNRQWFSDYTEGRQGGSLRIGRRLRWPDNYFRVFASYRLERNKFHDLSEGFVESNSYKAAHLWRRTDTLDVLVRQSVYNPYPGSIAEYEDEWLSGSRITATITRDSRNLPEFATKGSMLSYRFETTGGMLGGFWKYQKHSISIAKFIPIVWKIALAAKIQYGVVTSPAGDNRILVSDRFTPGGTAYDGIVRGYDDGVLTPDSLIKDVDTAYYYADSAGVTSGTAVPSDTSFNQYRTRVRGKYMLVTNLELQIPIAERQLYALLFFDAGNSWLNMSDIKPLKGLYRGVGIGFRVLVPGIGTIGFDFAYPLDVLRDEKQGWKPHFQIGTTFR